MPNNSRIFRRRYAWLQGNLCQVIQHQSLSPVWLHISKSPITKARKCMWSNIFLKYFFFYPIELKLWFSTFRRWWKQNPLSFFLDKHIYDFKMGFLKNKHINPLFRGFRKKFGQNSTPTKKISTTLTNFWVPKSDFEQNSVGWTCVDQI